MSSIMFISSNMVEAKPMTYGEFVEYVNLDLGDLDPETPGYMLQVSQEDYEWIPAVEFEESHMEVGNLEGLEPYQQRLLVERAIVSNNYSKLKKSFSRNTFLALPFEMRSLLESQERAMFRYLEVLNKRANQFLQ